MMRYLFPLIILFPLFITAQNKYDVIIRNGKIIDGTGNSWYYGDIGIKEGKIAAIQKHRTQMLPGPLTQRGWSWRRGSLMCIHILKATRSKRLEPAILFTMA